MPELSEGGVLLYDRHDPGRELGELRVELTDEPFAARNVESSCDFLEDDALSLASRQRDDVLTAVIGDQESGEFLQLLVRLLDVGQIEMGKSP